jgi:dipeptidyl aminopeptidase/acylaminoacyl peptidase
LVSDGLVDPKKIGIIGFSRSCYYVMETLTTSSLQLAAASINDGVTGDYLNYILAGGADADLLNGSKPFGQGLQQWLKSSPGFNLEKINTPLLITGAGPSSVLFMWQSYAGLHYLKKPVDLIMLNSNEHVLTNPAVRMASQSGSVDWFRFWLQGYEDPDPVKTEQYRRWRELKKLQSENEKKASTSSAAPN